MTIRLDRHRQKALAEAAQRQGKSVSQIVRDALDRSLSTEPLAHRAGHVQGRVRLDRAHRTPWSLTLRQRNWRS